MPTGSPPQPGSSEGPGATSDSPSESSVGESSSGGSTSSTTGGSPTVCEDYDDAEGCADAGCMVTTGRRWQGLDDGSYCVEPIDLLSCTEHIACLMPEFACPKAASPYIVEIIEGCLPDAHVECEGPIVAAAECP